MNNKIVLVFLILFALHSYFVFGSFESDPNQKVLQELKARGGLPNFFTKALHEDSIKVAYLGGSITAQDGWRVYSLEWLGKQFPKSKFTEINAAIGGTGSDLGVYRLYEHVLKFNPDLIFVEFAVNDFSRDPEVILRSMEGIVRRIWQQNSLTDICFIYTITDKLMEIEQNGELPASIITMEKVADYYNIPSVNVGLKVSKMVASKQLIFKGATKEMNGVKVFSPDGVHPYPETGHLIYHEALIRSFKILANGIQSGTKKHIMAKPLASDNLSEAQMVDFTQGKLSENWQILQINDQSPFLNFRKYFQKIGKASLSGETLTIRFKGKAIGAYDFMGPDAGKVIVEIDGIVKDTIPRFDEYCTYRRMNYFLIDHLEDKDHLVVFRLLAEPFDKAAILSKRGEIIRDSAEYKENNWYIGKILMDGKMIKE